MKLLLPWVYVLTLLFSFSSTTAQADPAANPLIDFAKIEPAQWVPSCDQVTVARSDSAAGFPAGIDVSIQPGRRRGQGFRIRRLRRGTCQSLATFG
jgi:hypothetical protein